MLTLKYNSIYFVTAFTLIVSLEILVLYSEKTVVQWNRNNETFLFCDVTRLWKYKARSLSCKHVHDFRNICVEYIS